MARRTETSTDEACFKFERSTESFCITTKSERQICKFTLIALKNAWPSHVRTYLKEVENNPAHDFIQSGGKRVLFIIVNNQFSRNLAIDHLWAPGILYCCIS